MLYKNSSQRSLIVLYLFRYDCPPERYPTVGFRVFRCHFTNAVSSAPLKTRFFFPSFKRYRQAPYLGHQWRSAADEHWYFAGLSRAWACFSLYSTRFNRITKVMVLRSITFSTAVQQWPLVAGAMAPAVQASTFICWCASKGPLTGPVMICFSMSVLQ